MTQSADALERLREALRDHPDVDEKQMVGGRSFLLGGKICCGVIGDRIMLRVGRDDYEWALSQPNIGPMVLGTKRPVGYVMLARAGYENDAELAEWVGRAVTFVRSIP